MRSGDGLYRRGSTWWLDFIHEGQRHYVRIGRGISKTSAREIAGVKRAAILKGEAGIGRKRPDLPFEKAGELFEKWAETNKRPRTAAFYAHALKMLGASFTGKKLSAITPFAIEGHKHRRLQNAGPVGTNRELATLKALFNRCIAWGKFEGENPVRKVKFLKEPAGRLRYLEIEEEKALLEAAKEPLRTIIIVGIHTGLRVASEALTLRWSDVDFRRNLVTVQAAYAKNGKRRSVPLNSKVRAALAALKEERDEDAEDAAFVFLSRKGSRLASPRTAFATAARKAKLLDVSPHVLRHTFASRLAMAGVDLRTIQELGGWETIGMVQRYAHLSPSHKAEAVERLAKDSTTVSTTPAEEPAAELA